MAAVANKFLVVCNIQKKHNVKDMIIAALAHGFQPLIVGARELSADSFPAPVREFLPFRTFSKLSECKAFLSQNGVPLVGIEIIEGAADVETEPFSHSIAVMPGNEGTGLSDKQKEHCDAFVFISQYGIGTASLNVNVATSIVLHRYCHWESQLVTLAGTSACTQGEAQHNPPSSSSDHIIESTL